MNFFEMIYHSGPEDFKSDFYKNNTKESRRHFFDRMLNNATHELDDPKQENDVDDFLLNMYQEEINKLNQMKDEFITNGRAKFDCYVSLCVAERTLKDV